MNYTFANNVVLVWIRTIKKLPTSKKCPTKCRTMSNSNNLKHDFKIVSYKNKHTRKPNSLLKEYTAPEHTLDKSITTRRIFEAKEEILTSDLYASIKASLREGLAILREPCVKSIVCFGLGKIGECTISRYQLALLLCLKELYGVDVQCYDPVFTAAERDLLSELGVNLLVENNEGKFSVDAATIFFMPHCPKQLTNNLLYSNWGLKLSNCIIIANSFTDILESNTRRVLTESAEYILKISPHLTELAVINSFKFFEIFNNTAIHIFPPDKLEIISTDFWMYCEEPVYNSDIEFVTKQIEADLSLLQI